MACEKKSIAAVPDDSVRVFARHVFSVSGLDECLLESMTLPEVRQWLADLTDWPERVKSDPTLSLFFVPKLQLQALLSRALLGHGVFQGEWFKSKVSSWIVYEKETKWLHCDHKDLSKTCSVACMVRFICFLEDNEYLSWHRIERMLARAIKDTPLNGL